jgi:hypothetical protein
MASTDTLHLIGVTAGEGTRAVVQRNDLPPVEVAWGTLHDAQSQPDEELSFVYGWLMGEFCRAEHAQRRGEAWVSPRLTVAEVVAQCRASIEAERAEAVRVAAEEQRRRDRRRAADAREQELASVEAARRETGADDPWWPIPSWEVPARARFSTPRRNQGQIVEVSYGDFGASEADDDAPYMHIADASDRTSEYYRRR